MKTFILISVITASASFAFANLSAHSQLMARSDTKARGNVDFTQVPEGLKIQYNLRNLPKNQTLGFHIHENADCFTKDARSAGGHFARVDSTGGTSLDNPAKYAGDLPSIQSDGSGKASGTFVVPDLSIDETKNSIVNRSIIVHGGPDDPNEKSAKRIACGVIQK